MSNSADELLEKLNNISSEMMMIDNPESDEIETVIDGLDDLHSKFEALQSIEDSEQIQEILSLLESLLDHFESLPNEDADTDFEDQIADFRETFQSLESLVREYGRSVDEGGSPARDDESDAETVEQAPDEDETTDSGEDSDSSGGDSGDEKLTTDPSSYDEELFYDFFSEATEHLETFEDVLLTLEGGRDEQALNEGFRGMHSIKGAAGFLDLRWVNNLAHAMEDLLGLYRDDGYRIEEDHIDLLFDSLDSLKKLINTHHESIGEDTELELDYDQFHGEIDRVRDVIEEIEESGETVDVSEEPSEPETEPEEDVELRETESIRIDTSKIDTIVNRAGELVTTFNQLKRQSEELDGGQSREQRQMYNQMDRIVSDLQEEALSLRMIPLKKTFSKTRRMVRDLSNEFGKDVDLTIEGEETELDRSLVEKIQDPLVHLVRNALDHGIESPEVRKEKGKDETGSLTISAYHESGDVVIEISDDGAGIDPEVIFEEAVEKDLVDPNEELSEQEIYMLLFEPGFSTTEEVTDVSGRGVGMDVVRKNIESIRGQIEVESEIDEGTTFRMKIPLTLSIINGMIMQLGDQRFVIPTTNILRSLNPDASQITTIEDRGEVLNLRGELISLCRINQLFNLDVEDKPFDESLIVIVQGASGKVGLQIDDILGQQEVVIKSLGIAFEQLRGISGAAILGDGQVGLILDTQTLEQLVA
ncbi:MAG: chemotaxis protein CheA [bacterium]